MAPNQPIFINSSRRASFINPNFALGYMLLGGALLPNNTRDVLLIGSPSTLQCYDIERNR